MPGKALPKLKKRVPSSDLDHVYAELKHSIMMGEFVPGQKLKLDELSEAFGTSHMPIREALNRLVVARAVVSEPRRSMRIPDISKIRLDQLIELRITLEGGAAELAVNHANSSLVDKLATINVRMDREIASKRTDIKRYLALNHEFHFSLYGECGNEDLLNLIEILWLRYGPLLNLLHQSNDELSYGHPNHTLVIDALKGGDRTAAKKAIQSDLKEASHFIRNNLPD